MQIVSIFRQYGFTREGLLCVLAFVAALVFALTLHELAHGLVALWNGDPTAKLYGRLTANPLKHFDIIGLVMMLLVGFGWAKPVPVNPNNFKNRKVGAITVSLAGILTNFLLAFLFAALVVWLGKVPVTQDTPKYYLVLFFFQLGYMMLAINVSLALFNLLPLFPLDGYRLLSCFVNESGGFMTFLRRYSLYILLGFLVLDYLPVISAYSPLNLYIMGLGGLIKRGFTAFWGLFL